MRESIKKILIRRDNMTEEEADLLIAGATKDLYEHLAKGELEYAVCEKWFGLEPDYLNDLIGL